MRITKKSSYLGQKHFDIEQHLSNTNKDLETLTLCLQGRVRFGAGTDNTEGENIAGEFQVFTSSATASALNAISHTLSSVPIGWLVLSQDKGGVLYTNSNTATNTTISLVSTTTSTNYTIFLLK